MYLISIIFERVKHYNISEAMSIIYIRMRFYIKKMLTDGRITSKISRFYFKSIICNIPNEKLSLPRIEKI